MLSYYKTVTLATSLVNQSKKYVYNNIIRTLLYRNVKGFGVKSVKININTSNYENTYLCDRLEQIPFKNVGFYTLKLKSVLEVYTSSFNSAFTYEDIMILKQDKEFDLDIELEVVENSGVVHSKYSPVQLTKWNDKNNLVVTLFDYKDISLLKEELKQAL